MRDDRNERLTILSEAEKVVLYSLPVFDDLKRIEFFAMTDAERSLALQRRGILKQVYCLLQIGYFKAKQAFFQFSLDDALPEDIAFLLQRYFPEKTLTVEPLSTNRRLDPVRRQGRFCRYRWRLLLIGFGGAVPNRVAAVAPPYLCVALGARGNQYRPHGHSGAIWLA